MKHLLLPILTVGALFSTPATFAAPAMDMKAMNMAQPSVAIHEASGVITKLDAKAGVVTISHGPVVELNWPAMTMGFRLQDRTQLAKLAVGQKVSFGFVAADQGYVITRLK